MNNKDNDLSIFQAHKALRDFRELFWVYFQNLMLRFSRLSNDSLLLNLLILLLINVLSFNEFVRMLVLKSLSRIGVFARIRKAYWLGEVLYTTKVLQ